MRVDVALESGQCAEQAGEFLLGACDGSLRASERFERSGHRGIGGTRGVARGGEVTGRDAATVDARRRRVRAPQTAHGSPSTRRAASSAA